MMHVVVTEKGVVFDGNALPFVLAAPTTETRDAEPPIFIFESISPTEITTAGVHHIHLWVRIVDPSESSGHA